MKILRVCYKMGTSPSSRAVDLALMTCQTPDIKQGLPRRQALDLVGSDTHKIYFLTKKNL